MPELNIPLLEATMQEIKDQPELHYQGSWITATECGTAFCFAGWAMHLSGYSDQEISHMRFPPQGDFSRQSWTRSKIFTMARDKLGLTTEQAQKMFDGDNTLEQLELMVKDLVNTAKPVTDDEEE